MHSPPSARIYCPPGYIDREDFQGNIALGDWRTNHGLLHPISQVGSNRYSRSAAEMRDTLMNSSSGTLPWQQLKFLKINFTIDISKNCHDCIHEHEFKY